ncbi:hypothetical protein GGR56DRAFT_659145 [Xylariaceae sp. FL0804]|nr:hypothetical protein GGR56DRAFT_659145 [Xylariaceae sp. FL0804]
MPEHLSPSAACSDATESTGPLGFSQKGRTPKRSLSRSPHPYHRQNFELLHPLDHYASLGSAHREPHVPPSRERTPSSDSGTEADDEHYLKGLPAPRRFHKGLRGRNEVVSGTSTPLASPAVWEDEGKILGVGKELTTRKKPSTLVGHSRRRRKEITRRLTELLVIAALNALVYTNPRLRSTLGRRSQEIQVAIGLWVALVLLYPLRLIAWAYWQRAPASRIPLKLPSSFDPAPLYYPPAITLIVSSLVALDNETVILPNIVLTVCSLPPSLVPVGPAPADEFNYLHWGLSLLPLLASRASEHGGGASASVAVVSPEIASLLYPLHYVLLRTLHGLTTTSLLTAELQLLSVALINVLLLSSSPQANILRAMLWVGGLDILVSCSQAILWGVALARVPKWRFRRPSSQAKQSATFFSTLMSWQRVKHDLFHVSVDSSSCSSCEAVEDSEDSDGSRTRSLKGLLRGKTHTFEEAHDAGERGGMAHPYPNGANGTASQAAWTTGASTRQRRHTLPGSGKPPKSHTHTPSGRRKRTASDSSRAFFSLTQQQATLRKWSLALYVYVCILVAVFVPLPSIGVKEVVQQEALKGYEPVGWALGYLFGDLTWFRWQVVSHDLERWICLPSRLLSPRSSEPSTGWVESLRVDLIGQANTRLLLSAYYVAVICVGLVVVFRLSPFYEVDTRRKVFHFMMVAMFLPATYIDPAFAALALAIILAVFLLLDLLRASQLPPLSKPLASFLAPYVDGRDLRGPVVISHIFLLIGCAIPLWLSLGSLTRSGTGPLAGWEVPTREVAMVSGVICVGLGDAAASLVGRRYGHRKWLWGGGKSLEGSAAFAVAVFAGLMAAHAWLRFGGWSMAREGQAAWGATARKAGVCASMASLTEAVLTGGNDNVIVPVVLWTCVKSLGV